MVQVYARLAFLFQFIILFVFKETHITPNVDGIEMGATSRDFKSETKDGEFEKQNHLKLEQQLDKLRILVEDR